MTMTASIGVMELIVVVFVLGLFAWTVVKCKWWVPVTFLALLFMLGSSAVFSYRSLSMTTQVAHGEADVDRPYEILDVAESGGAFGDLSTPATAEPLEQPAVGDTPLENAPAWMQAELPVISQAEMERYRAQAEPLPERLVVRSQLWSTPEEAASQAERLGAELVQLQASKLFDTKFALPAGTRVPLDLRQLIGDRYAETRPMALTEGLRTDMHRVSLLLNLDVAEFQQATPVVRQLVVQPRLIWLASGLGLLSLLLGGIAWTLGRSTNPANRG